MRSPAGVPRAPDASAHTPITVAQALEVVPESRLASAPTRNSSRSASRRFSGVDRSTDAATAATAVSTVCSWSTTSSAATAASTALWKSAWLSQIRPITEALVTRTPVVASTRSNTRLKVTCSAPVPRPS